MPALLPPAVRCWIWLALLVILPAWGCRSVQPVTLPTPVLPDGSSVWVASTWRTSSQSPGPEYQRYLGPGQWACVSREDFLANDAPGVPTVVFAHGGRANEVEGIEMGWDLWRQLSAGDCRPFRYVIYTWPTERSKNLMVDDLRMWEARTEPQGPLLASVIERIDQRVPVCLVGHSFGGPVVLAALDWLGGGPSPAYGNPAHPGTRSYRAVLLAPAVENDCLLPGHRYDHALGPVESLVLAYNPRDIALTHYSWLDPGRHQRAMGATGIVNPSQLGDGAGKIYQIDMSPDLGFRHRWRHFVENHLLQKYVQRPALFESSP